MIKPFRQTDLNTYEKNIYNYRISRARRIVENAFGILAFRFQIFHTDINIDLKIIESIVMTSCALQNYLTEINQTNYSPPESHDMEMFDDGTVILQGSTSSGSQMIDLNRKQQGNVTDAAKERKTAITIL